MATLNYIMPLHLQAALCAREDTNKVEHRWLPSGQSRAFPPGHVGVECYCKHCGERDWGTVSATEFIMISEYWTEL
jgi:hypothetical protein